MGGSQSKEINENSDTINWNKIKTDNISSTLPNFNGLSNEAQNLIASLNIPQITESQASEFTINHIIDNISNSKQNDQYKFNQLLDQELSQNNQENDLSATSPFISSEMYNYLIKNESQKGGGKNTRKLNTKKGGAKLDDDSDTSSTSSSSNDEDLIDSTEAEVLEKKKNKLNKKNNKHNKRVDSELSGGELSYLSSSAHTEGEFSDSHSAKQSSSESATTQVSNNSSSVSQNSNKSTVTDQNKYQSTSYSVNTDDINMVSDD